MINFGGIRDDLDPTAWEDEKGRRCVEDCRNQRTYIAGECRRRLGFSKKSAVGGTALVAVASRFGERTLVVFTSAGALETVAL